MQTDIAIALLCYDRLPLLKRCHESVVANGFGDYVVFCIDGGADEDVVAYCRSFANARCIEQPTNRGMLWHVSLALDTLFLEHRFERVVLIDSDVQLAPSCLRLLFTAQQWLSAHTLQRHAVVSQVFCPWPVEQKRIMLPLLTYSQATGTIMAIERISWLAAHTAFAKLWAATVSKDLITAYARRLPYNWTEMCRTEWLEHRMGFGIDTLRLLAFGLTGTRVASLLVNRAIVSAEGGAHTYKAAAAELKRTQLDIFEEDATLTNFALVEDDRAIENGMVV